ncbi:putative F-box domain-containing protein [Medicago truncatula]|uniref:F-box protein interaction domain protein n=1 Tax=Medicago truncatula TaxID=3880 RepID=A0A072U1T0_MEDTR|nr:F-box protein interaction domain protein [Medicago truncatula]RHN46383.1 putative F-box domain-containing protein [Medicago truncatula]
MNIPPAKPLPKSLAQPSSRQVILPDDLIFEVLSFLTVNHLMRFRCVCKSWNSLISSPSFIKIHRNKSERNKQIIRIEGDTSRIVSKRLIVNYWPVRGLVEKPLITLVDEPYCGLKEEDSIIVVGCCNGLVCLLGYYKLEYWLYFYNPATRKVSDKLGSFTWTYGSNIAFGFDNSTDTYKVVHINKMSRDVKVFSLGDDIWRSIQSFPEFCLTPSDLQHYIDGVGVYFSSTLNWLVIRNDITYDKDSNYLNFKNYMIISLNLGTEKYTQLLPPQGSDEVLLNETSLCVLMDCLCFCYHYSYNGTANFYIWKMKNFGVEKSWSRFLKISHHNLQIFKTSYISLLPLFYSENGDALILEIPVLRQLILYNWRTNKVERVITSTKRKRWVFLNNYIESLVSTNGK